MFRSLPWLLCAVFVADPAWAAFQIDSSTDTLSPAAAPSGPAGTDPDPATPADVADCDRSMVVTPGDTLISIARKELGNVSRLGELLEINRDRVRNPDMLRSGMTLRLPCDPETADAVAETESLEPPVVQGDAPALDETPVQAEAATPACTRETVVQPGDTLGAIARKELGNVSRLGELLEINRDRVRNPDMLRSGMTLRLPCDPETATVAEAVAETESAAETEAEDTRSAEAPGTGSVQDGTEEAAPPAPEPDDPHVRSVADGADEEAADPPAPAVAGADTASHTPASAVNEVAPGTEEVHQEQPIDAEAVAQEVDAEPPAVRNAQLGGQPYETLSWGRDARWEANRGERLDNVLTRWGQRAGYTVIIRDRYPWVMGVNYQRTGDFVETVQDLLKGFSSAGRSPGVSFYLNDVMMLETR